MSGYQGIDLGAAAGEGGGGYLALEMVLELTLTIMGSLSCAQTSVVTF